MLTISLDSDSPVGKSEAFVNEHYNLLQRLYPDKWVVVYESKVLFASDSSDLMFVQAEALGMRRGEYYYRHILPKVEVNKIPSSLGI